MNCESCLTLLNDYLDAELNENVQKQVKTHLQACPVCHMQFERADLAKQFIHRKFCVSPAPSELQNRICRAIRKSSAKQNLRKIFVSHRMLQISLCLVAVITLVGSVWIVWRWQSPPYSWQLSQALVQDHLHLLSYEAPLQIQTSDTRAIELWFSDKLDWPVTVPRGTEADITLEGARLCKILNERIALVFYQRQKQRCSLFIFPDTSVNTKIPEAYVDSASGYLVHYWKRDKLLYALVAPEQSVDVAKFLRKTRSDSQK